MPIVMKLQFFKFKFRDVSVDFVFLFIQTELIQMYKYDVEVHHVITEDGYILELHRITGSPNLAPCEIKRKQQVLLMHGILDSSATWVLMHPTTSLGK